MTRTRIVAIALAVALVVAASAWWSVLESNASDTNDRRDEVTSSVIVPASWEKEGERARDDHPLCVIGVGDVRPCGSTLTIYALPGNELAIDDLRNVLPGEEWESDDDRCVVSANASGRLTMCSALTVIEGDTDFEVNVRASAEVMSPGGEASNIKVFVSVEPVS